MTVLSPRLQLLFEATKTVCFGRFVIEIPASATLVFGPSEVGPSISYLQGKGAQIAKYVENDLVEIETDREYFDEDDAARLPLFGKVFDGISPGQKTTMGSKDRVGYYINSYVPLGGDLFILHYGSVMHANYDAENFNAIASRLQLRTNEETPEESGTCIAGGFLPLAFEYERVTLGVRLKEFSDVHLSIEVHKNQDRLDEGASLELMLKQGEELAKQQGKGAVYARIKTIRRGPRQLGQWKGFEMVARKPEYMGDTDAHEFRFQSLGAAHDPLQPRLDIRLDSGVKNNRTARIKPSLTDEEAVALWDKLIESIRARPTADAKASDAAPVKVPLGKLSATGDKCTQQGWWQCVEGENVEGGRRRHLTAGEAMPHVILLGEQNLWQKLTGNQPKHTSATVWKLVEYDAEPGPPSIIAYESSTLPDLAPMLPPS